MRRKLSSNSTPLVKYGAPALLTLAMLVSALAPLFIPLAPASGPPLFPPGARALVPLVSLAFWGYALYLSLRLTDVALDGDRLICTAWRRSVEVPLQQVEAVEQAWWRPGVAEIHLRRGTEMGDRILFLPMQSAVLPWVLSPTVRELRVLVDESRLGSAYHHVTQQSHAQPQDYSAQWRYYFYWRRAFWLTLLTYLPGVFALGYLLRPALGNDVAFPGAWGVWVVAFFVTELKLRKWLCPHCRMPFFETRFGFPLPHPFVRACRHCGLPKGGARPPAAAA